MKVDVNEIRILVCVWWCRMEAGRKEIHTPKQENENTHCFLISIVSEGVKEGDNTENPGEDP